MFVILSKKITGNDERTKRCPQWYCNDRKFCESSNYIKNKSSNIECPEYEVPSSWNPKKIRFKLSRKWMKTLTLKDAWLGALFLNILFQINGLWYVLKNSDSFLLFILQKFPWKYDLAHSAVQSQLVYLVKVDIVQSTGVIHLNFRAYILTVRTL